MGTMRLMSAQEFLNLPDEPGKQELLDGELIAVPPAKMTEKTLMRRLERLLETVVPDDRVWQGAAYQLGRRGWLSPDVSVTWPDQPVDEWLQGAPMIAAEVVSWASLAGHLEKKTAAYLDEGAAEVWIIYPETPSMVVFRKESWERVTETYEAKLIGLTVDLRALTRWPE